MANIKIINGNYVNNTPSGEGQVFNSTQNSATGGYSHSEGQLTIASGTFSHAQNANAIASGINSHAGGGNTEAAGISTFVHCQGDPLNFSTADANFSAILGGFHSQVSNTAIGSVVLGCNTVTATQAYTAYVDNLHIGVLGAGAPVTTLALDTNGYVVSAGAGGVPSGTQILLYTDETEDTGVNTAANVKTYTLPANTYSYIVAECEVGFQGGANSTCQMNFTLDIGGVISRVGAIRQPATGAGDFMNQLGNLKILTPFTAGGNITLSVTEVSNGATWFMYSLRVYGII